MARGKAKLQIALCHLHLALSLLLPGCFPNTQERIHDYNDDGLFLYRQGDYMAARESFKAALALEPDNADLYYNIAQCYDRLGKVAKAEKYYNDCLLRSPNHAACRHALAALLVRDKRSDDAARMIADWMSREPKLATPFAEDGWLYHQKGDLPLARTRLEQALLIDPRDFRALFELALVYENMNYPDRALVLYERILERDPSQTEVTERVNFLLAKGVKKPQLD